MVRLILMLLFFWISFLSGKELEFSARVDRTTVALGEPFRLTVTVEGSNISRVPRPQLPALDDFENLGSSQSQSTNISIINGRVQQRTAINFVYTLVPKRLGELKIGSCRLVYNNNEYTTEPITINVVKGASRSQSQPQPRTRMPFDIFEEPEPLGKDDLMLVSSVDKRTVYQGEQITATWRFYTNQQVGSLSLKDPPSLTGFWSDDIYQPRQLEYEPTTVNGKRYYAAIIKRTALFPTQSGQLRIGAMKVQGEVVVPGFLFASSEPFEVLSEPVTVTVKPLPEEGKPVSFTGGVGSFQVSASLSSTSSTGGEPVTLSIAITGTGNLGLIGPANLPAISGLKILAPETKDNFSYTGGKLSGTRVFNYPLLPTTDGRYRIPEIEFGFFDPQTGSYYTRRTQALELVVTGVPSRGGAVETGQPGLRVLGSDIRHIKPDLGKTTVVPVGLLEVVFYPTGFFILGAGLLLGYRRQRLKREPGYARRARAFGRVRKELRMAEQMLKSNRLADFYLILRQALLNYAGDRYNIPTGALTGEELKQRLQEYGVGATVIESLINAINQCEIARFSPGAVECAPQQLLSQTKEVISRL